ncbi:unnamed protein product, partial [Owenia fusiformis]
ERLIDSSSGLPVYRRKPPSTNPIEIDRVINSCERLHQPFVLMRNLLLLLKILGKKVEHDSFDFKEVYKILNIGQEMNECGDSLALDIFPWLRFCGNRTYKALQNFKRNKDALLVSWIQQSEISLQSGERSNGACETLVQYLREGKLSYGNVHGIVSDILFAGVSTTSTTLTAFFLVLINKPAVQEKIQEEIDRVIGGERLPTLKDRSNMPYTCAAILEALRYTTTLALSLPHRTVRDTSVGGFSVPNDTTVWVNLWAMHHDDRYFEDPYTYRVERFLGEDGDLLPPNERKSFLPFGVGRRVCLGETLARARLFLFVASLLQKVDILPENETNIPDPDPAKFNYAMVNIPTPFNIVVKQRKLWNGGAK